MCIIMAERREIEVVVFDEPVYNRSRTSREAANERDLFLKGDVSDIFSSREHAVTPRETKTKSESSASELNFKDTLREVQFLAASTLAGKTRRKFEENQIHTLGAKPPKPDYVPYPHYQMVTKAKHDKEKRLAMELKVSQNMKKRSRRARISVKGKGRWKDKTKSLEPAVGKFKNGVLTLKKRDLANLAKIKN